MEGSNSDRAGSQREKRAKSICVDFLGLANCTVTRLDELEHILLAHATYRVPEPSGKCEQCHGSKFRTSTRPNRELLIWDIPSGGCPVLIRLTTWPMICAGTNCHTPFREDILWYHPRRNMTWRLEKYIRERAATLTTFQQIALDTCQDRKTVHGILFDAIRELEKDCAKDLPRVLGIDEIYFGKKAYTILVDIESGKAVDLLEGRSADSVRKRFEEATNCAAVEYVTQDFSQSYRAAATQPPEEEDRKLKKKVSGAAVNRLQFALFTETPGGKEEAREILLSREALKAMLPNAKIVGDHFHFAQAIVDEGFNQVRIKVKKDMKKNYRAKMLRKFLNLEEQRPLPKHISSGVRKQVKDAVNKEADRLDRNKFLLFERLENLSRKPEKMKVVNELLREHPLLARAWNLKESGLKVFPVQPSLGRTRKSREAAMIERAKLRLSEEETARRLDAWAKQVSEQEDLAEFFKRAVNMVKNWRAELIRIGTTGYSNAATESKNRYLRSLASISRGLPFETLRARLLWADANHREDRWPSFCDGYDGEIDNDAFLALAHDYLAQQKS
jgi:transposase